MKEIKTLRKKELKRFQIVTTIHKDVTERLEKINASLAAETRKVFTYAWRCASEYFLKKCIDMAEIK